MTTATRISHTRSLRIALSPEDAALFTEARVNLKYIRDQDVIEITGRHDGALAFNSQSAIHASADKYGIRGLPRFGPMPADVRVRAKNAITICLPPRDHLRAPIFRARLEHEIATPAHSTQMDVGAAVLLLNNTLARLNGGTKVEIAVEDRTIDGRVVPLVKAFVLVRSAL